MGNLCPDTLLLKGNVHNSCITPYVRLSCCRSTHYAFSLKAIKIINIFFKSIQSFAKSIKNFFMPFNLLNLTLSYHSTVMF